jgi:hypothetical protein
MTISSYSGQPSSKGSTTIFEHFFGGAGGPRFCEEDVILQMAAELNHLFVMV